MLAAVSIAAFATSTVPVQLINPAGSSSGQTIVSTGPSSAPAWATVPLSGLSSMAANTVVGNFTGSSAAPAAFSVPSCSTVNSALQYTSGTGLACGTSFALTSGTLAQFASTSSAQLAGVLSDETGTGFAVFATSPIITTPNIQGITNGAVTGAGFVGETIKNTPSTTSISTATNTNLASISITAGKWLVWGYTVYSAGASTTISNIVSGLSTTSATLPGVPFYAQSNATMTAATSSSLTIPMQVLNVTSTTTVFAVGQVTFASGSCTQTTQMWAVRIL
ncbi:hypothetical protein C9I56_11115 [Paraburkholderia caribensis]|nr:hypothetical protein C9I56_11115 [Paraburkholderia caribensis]